MKNNTDHPNEKDIEIQGYTLYAEDEDVFVKSKKEINKKDTKDKLLEAQNPNRIGDRLDMLGFKVENNQESMGSKDEENNYYRLPENNHNESRLLFILMLGTLLSLGVLISAILV
jgi:hypothetical protein